ncbi:DUF1353 domain-containing protein [Methylobacterium sp. CM6241]
MAIIMNDKINFLKIALATKDMGEPAPLVPFSQWDYYYIDRPLKWQSNASSDLKIEIPKGFVTDLASIPQVFWSILPKTSSYTYPAIFHDYLYWFQPAEYDRNRADSVFSEIMLEVGVNKITRKAIYESVRLLGGKSWDANKVARENGESRVLKRFPTKATISWQDWKLEPDVFL